MINSDRRAVSRFNLLDESLDSQKIIPLQETLISNISPNGACISMNRRVSAGSIFDLTLQLSQLDSPLKLTSKIVWAFRPRNTHNSTWKYGVLFFQVTPETRNLIETLPRPTVCALGRRQKSRRSSEEKYLTNNRQKERRGSNQFLLRINRIDRSFDKWAGFHTYKRVLDSINFPNATVNGAKKIMLGSNSYLGLSTHPMVTEAAIKAIEKFGVGSGGVPVLSGTNILHEELCATIADFKGTEAAILYPSGYIANYTCLSTLFGEDDLILNDERNHASIIDGTRMSKANFRIFKHNDMNDLEKKINLYESSQNKIIIVDGVFSMDGDLCKLSEVYSLAKKYNTLLMVDDAHSTGVVGKTGRGTAEHFGLLGKIDLTTVTLSKAIGCIGGAICGSRALIKYLENQSRSFIFSTSLPPPICAGAIAAIKLIRNDPGIIKSLRENVSYIKEGLIGLGYNVPATESAIIPVIIGDEILTYKLTHLLDKLGVFVNAVSRPAVARELSRLRVSPNATHTRYELDATLKAFKVAGMKLGIIQ